MRLVAGFLRVGTSWTSGCASLWDCGGRRETDTHIGELRRKLERDPSSPIHILTVRKAGYRLARDPA